MSLSTNAQLAVINKDSNLKIRMALIAGACLAGMIGWCWYCAPKLALWYDEAVYNYKGWLLVNEYYAAYRDIRTQQPPLAYYPMGLVQAWFGPSMLIGRVYAAVCFFIGSLLAAIVAGRWAGPRAFAASLAFSLIHLFSASYYCLGTPLSQSMLLCAGCLLFLSAPRQRFPEAITTGIFAGLAAMTFSFMGLFAAGILVYAFLNQNRKHAFCTLAAAAAVVLIVLLPFWGNWKGLSQVYFPGSPFKTLQTAFPVYTPFSISRETGLLARFILAFLPFFFLMILGWHRRKEPVLGSPNPTAFRFFWILFFSITGFLAWSNGLSSRGQYTLFALAYFPVLLVPAAAMFARLIQTGKPKTKVLVLLALCFLVSMAVGPKPWSRSGYEPKSDLQRIRAVAARLRNVTTPDARVFAYGGAHFLLDAGRVGFAPLIDREQTMAFDQDADYVAGRNLYTHVHLHQWLQAADAAVADDWGLHSNLSMKAAATMETLKPYISGNFPKVVTLNPGDISANGGRPVRIFYKENPAAASGEGS